MRLFVAEKPSLARAIAEALPGPARPAKTHITCGDGSVVAWCVGHILETAPPERYRPELKTWRLEDLPIVPRDWKLDVSRPELLRAIETLLERATRVVHAGDPDREGQLLVDEVLEYLGYQGPVDRVLLRDLNPDAVRRQLERLEPNAKYRPLSLSALARQRADWLYGMNMSRLYTLLGRQGGYDGVLSVGRVQTPLLGLVVARDRAIAGFQPRPYFVLGAELRTAKGELFRARWAPGPAAEPHLDDQKRLLVRRIAEAVRAQTEGKTGVVTARTEDKKVEGPPLPYCLAHLQIDAAKRLGLSAQQALDTCQSLYETHRLLTYPRSDCSHLPVSHHAHAREVLAAVARQAPALAAAIGRADPSLRSKAWNDTKVTAHHAIVPTPSAVAPPATLRERERAVYELVATRYLAQFYPPHEYLQAELEIDIAGQRFVATGRQTLAVGWKAVAPTALEEGAGGDPAPEDKPSAAPLPRVEVGDALTATSIPIHDKKTQPPKAYTDASLLAAMCHVAQLVSDPNVRKILTEADGIGTDATRAQIIETLFERRYVARVTKAIVSTETGRALIDALPQVATTPDLTAVWEAAMRAIQAEEQSLAAFLTRVSTQLQSLVAQGRALGRIAVPGAPRHEPIARAPAPPTHRGTRRRVRTRRRP
jgi:DNA topoisomerase-3